MMQGKPGFRKKLSERVHREPMRSSGARRVKLIGQEMLYVYVCHRLQRNVKKGSGGCPISHIRQWKQNTSAVRQTSSCMLFSTRRPRAHNNIFFRHLPTYQNCFFALPEGGRGCEDTTITTKNFLCKQPSF